MHMCTATHHTTTISFIIYFHSFLEVWSWIFPSLEEDNTVEKHFTTRILFTDGNLHNQSGTLNGPKCKRVKKKKINKNPNKQNKTTSTNLQNTTPTMLIITMENSFKIIFGFTVTRMYPTWCQARSSLHKTLILPISPSTYDTRICCLYTSRLPQQNWPIVCTNCQIILSAVSVIQNKIINRTIWNGKSGYIQTVAVAR